MKTISMAELLEDLRKNHCPMTMLSLLGWMRENGFLKKAKLAPTKAARKAGLMVLEEREWLSPLSDCARTYHVIGITEEGREYFINAFTQYGFIA